MVMGSVAYIEERQKFNLGLGIPAGAVSVIAAGSYPHNCNLLEVVVIGLKKYRRRKFDLVQINGTIPFKCQYK